MNNCLLSSCLTAMLVLSLAAPQCEGARKKNVERSATADVEATVISLRRYEMGTYLEVLRDDGLHEWIEVNREEGLEVKADQRIAYSTSSAAHENAAFGMVRYGVDFRILPLQRGEQVYRETAPDGTMVFTDNPATVHSAETGGNEKPGNKGSRKQGADEVIVVDQDDLIKQKAQTEDFYRDLERTSTERPVRRAKRAKPRQN